MIIKKKNPIDKDFIKNINIKKSFNDSWEYEYGSFIYDIYYNDRFIGSFNIKTNSNYITDAQIYDPIYRRRGLATYIYDYIEKDLNIKLKPSFYLLKDGEAFWKGRLKQKNPKNISLAEWNRLHNIYRKEAIELWDLRSPFRQKVYIEARIKGLSPEEALAKSRGNIRGTKLK